MWREAMPLAVCNDQPSSRPSSLALSLWPSPPAPVVAPADPATSLARSTHIINQLLEQDNLYDNLTPYLQDRGKQRTTLTSLAPQAFRPTTTPKNKYKTFIYPTLFPQNVKWSPFVQMAACVGSSENISKLKCHCSNCINSRCPGRDVSDEEYYEDRCGFKDLYRTKDCGNCSPPINNKPFRDNIATFCDQDTMTCEMVNATCGICFGVDPMPPCAEDRRDVSTGACAVTRIPPGYCQPYKRNGPRVTIEGAKQWDMDERPLHCDRWHEPERDPGPCAISTNTISTNTTYPDGAPLECRTSPRSMLRGPSVPEENTCCEQRRILYNEGISDTVFEQLDNPVNVCKDARAIRNARMDCCEPVGETWIPHSHQLSSKYHAECKKYPSRRYRAPCKSRFQPECHRINISQDAPAPVTPVTAVAPPVAATDAARLHCSRTNVPSARRKLITSERNIESFLQAYIY